MASPVTGAVLASIIPKMPACHSEKISLKPLFTPSREQMKRKMPMINMRTSWTLLSMKARGPEESLLLLLDNQKRLRMAVVQLYCARARTG